MRGKVVPFIVPISSRGITPAYAGKRWQQTESPGFVKDHPRICGEKPKTDKHALVIKGSPPHMRGKADGPARQGRRLGITPAYAGKSDLDDGESSDVLGSPPHMRGKGLVAVVPCVVTGITPAYAGKRQ